MADFRAVPPQPDWPALEREILELWQSTDAFGQLVAKNAGAQPWSFLDGPITANNPMGVHHAWGRSYKDVWQRVNAMRGFDQRWQNGFDCQGLWVEVEVEKQLGFKTKRDIESYGIAAFVRRCKERVLRYAAIQTEQSQRLGMWMKWDDPDTLRWLADNIDETAPVTLETPTGPVTATVEWFVSRLGHVPWDGSYFTFSDENNTMIWRFLKECHRRGWIYKGTDVMPWCSRCGTGLSQHEIATEGYQELTHLSPTLRLPLVDRPGESLLVWTTTPWTLPANVAAAVGPDLVYAKVQLDDQIVYLAEAAVASLGDGAQVLERLPGADLVGWRYTGPFDELPAAAEARSAHRVIPWDEVGAEEGTGVVHIAPGAGAEDFALSKIHALPVIAPLGEDGRYTAGYEWLSGESAHEVAERVTDSLRDKGLLLKVERYTHRYPVCWRCSSQLVFRLVDEWFISMGPVYGKPRSELTAAERRASLRYQVMDIVERIRWIPAFGRERELDWLRNMHDWMISKKRYWGLALPIWVCGDCGGFEVIGGLDELADRAAAGWDVFEGHSPHRPYIDAVELACPVCGGRSRRIADVGNPWLDAGIVPYSTLHYDSDRDAWQKWFPAEFITESFPGQFRNWFYSLLVMSTVLEEREPFKAVLGYATLFAEDGRAMHKSWGNMIEFNAAADTIGSDVMRWMYLATRPEQNMAFGYHGANEVRRRFLLPLWNVYGFFVQYANASDWQPAVPSLEGADCVAGQVGADAEELDRWLAARLAELAQEVSTCLDAYDPHGTAAAFESFVDELSTWYVRRSRRRFWDAESPALDALYGTLVRLTQLMAPVLPFTAEALYQNLVRTADPTTPDSVHLTGWPKAAAIAEAPELLDAMALVRRLAALGRAARSSANVKLRQPLAKALVAVRTGREAEAVARLESHLRDELNVKAVEVVMDEGSIVDYAVRPVLPKLGPVFGPRLPEVRAALAAQDPGRVAVAVRSDRPVELTLANGEVIQLEPDHVEVMAVARAGLVAAEEAGYVTAILTDLTAELVAEGLARDVVRTVNQLRKDSGLDISDRVRLWISAPTDVIGSLSPWHEYIATETLARHVEFEQPGSAMDGLLAGTTQTEIEGHAVTLAISRVTA